MLELSDIQSSQEELQEGESPDTDLVISYCCADSAQPGNNPTAGFRIISLAAGASTSTTRSATCSNRSRAHTALLPACGQEVGGSTICA